MRTPPSPAFAPPKADEPPLHRAARTGDEAAIRALGATGDLQSVFDMQLDPGAHPTPATPLMVAAGSGEGATAGTVRLLLGLGADPKATAGGRSAADFACSGLGPFYRPGGDAERLRLLLEAGSPLSVTGEVGARLVGAVAESGDAERLAVLLAHGASPHAWLDPHGRRRKRPWDFLIPLFCAVDGDSIACVRLLLDAGADVRQRDDGRRTALWKARSEPMVRLLLERGLALEDRAHNDWTPLTAAALDGIWGLPRLRALLACGADPNATHDHGYTVFMSAVASMERHPDVLHALIEGGADPHAVTGLGYNAFHAAMDVSGDACSEDSVRLILAFLRQAGVDIEALDRNGHTPLALAVLEGIAIEVRVLVELGANPNVIVREHCGGECSKVATPLIFHAIASVGGRAEMVEALLQGGANLDVLDPDGRSPLEYAIAHRRDVKTWKDNEYKQGWLNELDRCIEILRSAEGFGRKRLRERRP
jgi:ankyrin repeat protein